MGKSGQNFNKVIGNRIKAKGLQKLRWFCQVCEKQCRDENGFKCHINSESHQRAMVSFSHNAGKMLSQYSREFEGAFLDIAKRRARSQFIAANLIYNELISDRNHTHMNSTVWVTLGNFVGHLAQSGKCLVEERPKGLFVMFVEKDPDQVRRQEAVLKTRKHELDEEARNMEFIKGQVAKAYEKEGGTNPEQPATEPSAASALDLSTLDSDAFSFSLKPGAKRGFGALAPLPKIEPSSTVVVPSSPLPAAAEEAADKPDDGEGEPNSDEEGGMYVDEFGRLRNLEDDAAEEEQANDNMAKGTELASGDGLASGDAVPAVVAPPSAAAAPSAVVAQPPAAERAKEVDGKPKEVEPKSLPPHAKSVASDTKRKLTAVEEIMLAEENKKEKMKRRDYWLDEGIVVKVVNKQLADGKYYKKKGVVEQVIDRYVGLIAMLDPDVKGHKLKLDQGQLETVIPAIGGKMRIVNGAYRGEQVTLMMVDVDNFCVQAKIDHGLQHGRVLDRVPYEDICKLQG